MLGLALFLSFIPFSVYLHEKHWKKEKMKKEGKKEQERNRKGEREL